MNWAEKGLTVAATGKLRVACEMTFAMNFIVLTHNTWFLLHEFLLCVPATGGNYDGVVNCDKWKMHTSFKCICLLQQGLSNIKQSLQPTIESYTFHINIIFIRVAISPSHRLFPNLCLFVFYRIINRVTWSQHKNRNEVSHTVLRQWFDFNIYTALLKDGI